MQIFGWNKKRILQDKVFLLCSLLGLFILLLWLTVNPALAASGGRDNGSKFQINTGATVSMSQCYPCHGNRLDDFKKPNLIFTHTTHLARQIACNACHQEFPHQAGQIIKSVPMVTCFICHGLTHGKQGQMASKDCRLCHPPYFDLRPSSHGGDWAGKPHAVSASQDTNSCLTCHNKNYCEDCHRSKGIAPAPDSTYIFQPYLPPKTAQGLVLQLTEPVTSSKCSPCHGNRLDVFRNPNLIFNHMVHLAKGIGCDGCHKVFPHHGGVKERPTMAACYGCHGLLHGTEKTVARRECTVCHPPTFNLSPATHDIGWIRSHGKEALTQKPNCFMCHTAKYCFDCHELEMPHPADFATKHKLLFKKSTTVSYTCAHCHQDKNWCESCHHKEYGFVPGMGQWILEHKNVVKGADVSTCRKCHELKACPACHLKGGKR